jgi:hypothetical protein
VSLQVTYHLRLAVGTLLDETFGEARALVFAPTDDTSPLQRLPTSELLLYHYSTDAEIGCKFEVHKCVPSDPFLGPLYSQLCCSTCGLLPDLVGPRFKCCSRCKNPAAGRFCCQKPCFAAAWKKGHKNKCTPAGGKTTA